MEHVRVTASGKRWLVLEIFTTYCIYTKTYALSIRLTDMEIIQAIKQCRNISRILQEDRFLFITRRCFFLLLSFVQQVRAKFIFTSMVIYLKL